MVLSGEIMHLFIPSIRVTIDAIIPDKITWYIPRHLAAIKQKSLR
jgi:hypothetical protein